MRSYKVYLSAQTSAGNNLANLTFVKSGRIKSIRWCTHFQSITASSWAAWELSTFPSSQFTTNGAQGIVAEKILSNNFVTSGLSSLDGSSQTMLDHPVGLGEKLYLHLSCGGTISSFVSILIDVAE